MPLTRWTDGEKLKCEAVELPEPGETRRDREKFLGFLVGGGNCSTALISGLRTIFVMGTCVTGFDDDKAMKTDAKQRRVRLC